MIGPGNTKLPISIVNYEGYAYLNPTQRFSIDPDSGNIIVQEEIADIWQPASFETGANSLWVGKNVGIAGIGHHLASESADGHLHLFAHNEFDAVTGLVIADTQIVDAYAYTERAILQGDNSGTWTGTEQTFQIVSPAHLLANDGYLQTDSTSATEAIRYRIYHGTDETGVLIFDQTYPSSDFPAATEVQFMAHGYIEFDSGDTYFHKITSDANFSLKMDVTNTTPWFASDISFLREDILLQTKPWISGDLWTNEKYFIDDRQIYICTTTGIQTGTFASNSDKWSQLASEAYVDAAVLAEDFWDREGAVLSPKNDGDDISTSGDIYAVEGTFTDTLNLSSTASPSIQPSGNRLTINTISTGPPSETGFVTQFASGAYSRSIFAISDTGVNTAYFGLDDFKFTIGGEGNTDIRFRKSMEFGSADILNSGTDMLVIDGATSNIVATGTITSPTFLGDLLGTINTATTGATQSIGDNSTLIATTAYSDASSFYRSDGEISSNRIMTGNNDKYFQFLSFDLTAEDYTKHGHLLVDDVLGVFSVALGDGAGADVSSASMTLNSAGTDSIIFTDTIHSKGVVYDADYSGNYTDRSLVDKGYVDAAIAVEDLWDRIGTVLSPKTAGDDVTTTGSVGVGTLVPSHPLHVLGSINQLALRVQANVMNSDNWHGIGFSGEGFNTKGGLLWQSNNTQYSRGSIVFAINSESNQNNVTIADERMRITEGGHVGIGNSDPIADLDMLHTDNAPMHVQLAIPGTGNAQEVALDLVSKTESGYVLGDTANSKGWKFLVLSDAFSDAAKQNDFGLIHWDGSTWQDRLWIEHSNGHMGLGTTTPAARLDIIDTSDSQLRLSYDTAAFHSFNVNSDGSMGWTPRGTNADIGIDFTSADDGDFYINTNLFYVDTSAGRVGIGTATPQSLLDVNGDLVVDTDTFFVDALTHKVGIGTLLPGAELDVHGIFRNVGTATLQAVQIETSLILGATSVLTSLAPTWNLSVDTDFTLSGNVDSLNFDSNTLSIDSLNNRVGIGNNAPSTALHVTGTITADLHAGTAVNVTGDITTGASLYQPVFGDQTGQVLSLTFSEFAASIQYDESREDNDCVMTGGTVTASNGKYGSGVSLNGTTNFGTITSPNFPSSNGVRTFEALVYADSVGPGNFTIFSYGQHLSTNIFAVERTLTSLRVFTLGDSVSSASGVFSASTWHLVQVTYSGTHIDAWMDGVQVITNQALTVTTAGGTDAYVGRDVNDSSFWNGDIDFIRMYDRVLLEDELRSHYLRITGGSVVRSESFKVINEDDVVTLEAGRIGTSVPSLYQPVYGDDSGLILDLPFKEIGSITQYDRSPTGAEVTLENGASVTATAGPFGSGIILDGIDDYVDLPDIPNSFSNGITLEIWAYPTAVQGWGRFFDLGQGASDDNILFTREAETDNLQVEVIVGSVSGGVVIASDQIDLNQWQYFVTTIDGSGNVIIYKNGEQVGSGTTGVIANVTRSNSFIGRSNWGSDDYYKGNFANPKIYERVLSPAEIKAYYLRGNNTDSMSVIKSDKAQVVDTSNNAYDISLNPSNVVEIRTAADLEAQAVGGVITVDSAKTFVIKSQIVTDVEFVINTGAVFGINFENSGSLVYTDSGTLFSGSGGRFFATNGMLIASGGGTLINHTGQVGVGWAFKSLNIIGFAGGSMDLGLLSLENVNLIFPTDTLTFTEVMGFKALNFNLGLISAFNKPVFEIVSTAHTGAVINVNTAGLGFPGTGSLLKLGPAINDANASILVSGVNIVTGELFGNSGSTGTFTAVADASVSATSITSVTDSSGLARFNFSVGPTVYPYQEIVISGFTTNTAYNGTWIITSTGAGYLEVKRIAFGSDETGSFLSNSITLTDNGTSLSDGDSITIDTIFTTDYDGGTWVYNKQTNSVQVNKTWVANETGYWDASGLDQRDPRVLANTNPGKVDSHYIANGYVNGNSTACGTIVNNTFTDMVFGPTIYNSLVEGSSMERWKLIDDINGTFEYTGKEPFDGSVTYGVTAQSTGGAIEFRYKWVHDVGAGFVDLPDVVEAANEIAGASSATFAVVPLQAVRGDKIKPQITRSSGTSGITITHFQVNTQQ